MHASEYVGRSGRGRIASVASGVLAHKLACSTTLTCRRTDPQAWGSAAKLFSLKQSLMTQIDIPGLVQHQGGEYHRD